MKIAAIVTITALVIFPLITGSYIFRRACKKKADTLGRLLKDEMKYRGLR
jgi:hypothetical protein